MSRSSVSGNASRLSRSAAENKERRGIDQDLPASEDLIAEDLIAEDLIAEDLIASGDWPEWIAQIRLTWL